MKTDDRLRLRAKQAAEYLGVSLSTLAKWRMREEGPPYHRLGQRLTYYYKHEIDAWLAECDRRYPKGCESKTQKCAGGSP